ncbi:hypothetical protein K2Z84_30010, partial [Candidatus Binatia bacterium]|nr:hypothetical protein [Candidatus Binatia bacterium]
GVAGRGGGSGLGLAIASEIASRHGGRVVLVNHPEGGALAELVLPGASDARRAATPLSRACP